MKKVFLILIFVILCSIIIVLAEDETLGPDVPIAYAPELNTLNYIESTQGSTVEISTKILIGSYAISDALCRASLVNLETGEVMFNVSMDYVVEDEAYDHYWISEPPSSWDEFVRFFGLVPPMNLYYDSNIVCFGGSLNETVLNDVVVIHVVGD